MKYIFAVFSLHAFSMRESDTTNLAMGKISKDNWKTLAKKWTEATNHRSSGGIALLSGVV